MIYKKLTATSWLLLLACTAWSQTSVLDWNTVNWGAGSTSQTFTDVDGSGIDITISLTLTTDSQRYSGWEYNYDRNRWQRTSYTAETQWINGGPDDNNTFSGDGSAYGDESLYLGVDLATDTISQSYLDVTISFSQAVDAANFSLFDVDRYGYNYSGGYETGIQFTDVIEQIEGSYMGSTVTGTIAHDTSKILAVTNPTGPAYQGNTSTTDSNDQADNPKSTLNLAWSSPVDTVSFRYGSGTSAVADPGNQAIGLSNINFYQYQAVPEPSTYLFGAMGSLTLAFSFYRKRKKKSMKDMSRS